MFGSNVSVCAWFEILVIIFQVVGVATLCMTRLAPSSRWGASGRAGFVVALVGLGIAGALCGGHDSEFGLFAGGTMTFLLIGMTVGGGCADTTLPNGHRVSPEAAALG